MAILNQKRILNLIPKISAPVTLHVSQGDVGTEIEFTLVKGDELFVNTGNLTASVHGVREDGANFGPFTCTLSGSKVTFPLHSEMTAAKGSALAEIVLVDNGGNKVGSANFAFLIEKSAFPLGVTYDNDVSVYESILAYVQTIPAQVVSDYTSKINEEATARQNAVNAVQSNLNNEINARTSAVNAVQSNLDNEITARTSADTLINTRIDEIIAPSGQAPSVAEVTDARIGADGVTYASLGVAIRTQVGDLKSTLNKQFDEQSYNILYFPEWEKGKISSSTGEDVAANNNARSRRYIDVLPSTQYTGSWDASGFTCYVYFYSSESASGYISYSAIYVSGRQFTTPANATKIRVEFYKPGVTNLSSLIPDKVQIVQGATEKAFLSGECLDPCYLATESIPGNRLVPGTIKNGNLEDNSIYGAKIKEKAITEEKINEGAVSFVKTDFYQTNGNLFDGSFSFGFINPQGEVIVTTRSNAISPLIDLYNESTVYTLVSTVGTGITKYIHWYASDGTYLGYIADSRQTEILPCVAPTGARYMRIGTYKDGETVLANLTPTGIRLLASGLPTPETTGEKVLGKAYYTNNFANQSPEDATIRGVAHKGLCAEAPENTSAAFVAARKKGFRYIETDVRKTSDGHYVLIHDQTVDRTTNGTGNVADKTLAQLQALDAGSWFGSAFAGEKILSLEEACVLFRKLNLIPYLELKYKPSDATEAQAMNEIVKKSGIKYIWLGDAPDYVLFKQADPKISFCYLASVVPSSEAYQIIADELNSGMDVMISLEKTALTTAFAEQCARDGIKLDTYTVNGVDEMKTITSTYAVNGILSDGFHVDAILQKYEF